MLHNGNTVLSDELAKTDINCKGYGILFKYPMLDPALTIEAKGIYCYICSYAGSDLRAFPGRERILSDLKMSKDAYYRHYQLLLDNDYIRVHQENRGGNSRGFTRNIYEIVENPSKFQSMPEILGHAGTYSKIRRSGLQSAGFGYIPRSIMLDDRLSVKAKALYGYYRSYSGTGSHASPEKKHLLYHLGISSKLYQKLIRELEELNYITVEQRHVNGRLSVNEIVINAIPDESRAGERQLHVISLEDKSDFIVQKQDTQNQERQKQDTQKTDTNKSKINKNNSIQKQSNNLQKRKDTSDRRMNKKNISFYSSQTGKLGRHEAKRFVSELVDLESRMEEMGSSFVLCQLFAEALTDMLCTERIMNLTGEKVCAVDVLKQLSKHICRSADGSWMLLDIQEAATENFEFATMNRSIRNRKAYFKACIWSALKEAAE